MLSERDRLALGAFIREENETQSKGGTITSRPAATSRSAAAPVSSHCGAGCGRAGLGVRSSPGRSTYWRKGRFGLGGRACIYLTPKRKCETVA